MTNINIVPDRFISRWTAYPNWYVVPSSIKDDLGGFGGTIQARMTCRGPAIQTFPKGRKPGEVNLINYITSRFPEGFILWADLSQIELRVAAICSGDAVMTRCFTEGLNLHRESAKELFGPNVVNSLDFKSIYYPAGKTKNFADLNLAGPERMQSTLFADTGILIDLSVFQKAVQDRESNRPGLFAYQQRLFQEALLHKKITLPITGHSRTFLGSAGQILKQKSTIVNYPIQTHAAIVTEQIQIALEKIGNNSNAPYIQKGGGQILNVYDAWAMDVPKEDVPLAVQHIHEAVDSVRNGYWAAIEDHYKNKIPLEFELEEKNFELALTMNPHGGNVFKNIPKKSKEISAHE